MGADVPGDSDDCRLVDASVELLELRIGTPGGKIPCICSVSADSDRCTSVHTCTRIPILHITL